ncbi:MAG: SPOR domain-containing protein [Blastocatellia bacterium]|nr:SPOR domain-containing protein [Blastocatellia bacterium]
MIEASSRLTSRDKRALAIFAGLVGACSIYLASGKLVAYVSQPSETLEVAKDGKGFTVRVLGLQTLALAERQSEELRNRYGAPVEIEAAPTGQSFLIKVGPLAKLSDAESLMNKLRTSHNSIVRIVRNCGPGISDCDQDQRSPLAPSGQPSDPNSNTIQDEGRR